MLTSTTFQHHIELYRVRREETPSSPASENGDSPDSKESSPQSRPKVKLTFHCQQAQGSPTGIISGFTNVKELYQKISECYDMPASEVMFDKKSVTNNNKV
jgi:hypothetical protein